MAGKTNDNRRSNPLKSEFLKTIAFNKRKKGLKKKIFELSTLCGLEACMISVGPDGEIDTWPDEKPKLESIINRYRSFSEEERGKNNTDISEYLETKRKKLEVEGAEIGSNGNEKKKKNSNSTKYPSWDERLDGYSEKDLRELRVELDTKLENVKNREELKKRGGEKQSKTILKEEALEKEESENKALVLYTSDEAESNNEFLQQLLFDPTVQLDEPPWCCSSGTGVSSSSWDWDWNYWNHQPQIIFGSTTEFIYDDPSSMMKFDGTVFEPSASNFSYGYETMDDPTLMYQMGTEQSPYLLPVISQQTPPPLATVLPSPAQEVFRFHTSR